MHLTIRKKIRTVAPPEHRKSICIECRVGMETLRLGKLERIMTFQQNPLQPGDWQKIALNEITCYFSPAHDQYKLPMEWRFA